jgi:hypothetical protein
MIKADLARGMWTLGVNCRGQLRKRISGDLPRCVQSRILYSSTAAANADRHADVLKLADKLVSEASGLNRPCGFKSHHPHFVL